MPTVVSSLEFVLASRDFVELRPQAGLRIDLRYASENNFIGRNMYGPFDRAFLHRIAAEKLFVALEQLKKDHPTYSFIVFDALRPRSVQRLLWNYVQGTDGEQYFANPELGSLHSFGFAVDLSILDEKGRELDMGAGFDDFRPVAQPRLESQLLSEGKLKPQHILNRDILRKAMDAGGFTQLPHEWWHFDALPKSEVRGKFPIVE